MARSQRLKLEDFRNVFRLIGELCELGHDVPRWRRHMLERMNELIGARISYVMQARPPFENGIATISDFLDVGLGDKGQHLVFEYLFEGGFSEDPLYKPMLKTFLKGRHFTRTRRQLLPDDKLWRSYPMREVFWYGQMRVDDFMTTQYFLGGPFTCQAINFHRDRSEPRPFEEREQKLAHLFHTELGRLWENKELPKPDPCEGLPLRMRQVVRLIRAGDTEKEIAVKTALSPHTVHDHVKRLHAHFGVTNRAALLSATNPPPVAYRPALSP
jgi:DNA-binding CsgD family transcriptional regulator